MRIKKLIKSQGYKSWLWAFVLSLAFSGCFNQYKDLEKLQNFSHTWNPEVALPVGEVQVKLSDFLDEVQGDSSFVEIDETTNQIQFVYSQPLLSKQANELFDIPSQSFQTFLSMPEELDAFHGTPLPFDVEGEVSSEVNRTFTTEGNEELNSLTFKKAILTIDLSTNAKADGSVLIDFPNLSNGEDTFNQLIPLNNSEGSGTYDSTFTIDLSGYTINLYDDVNDKANTFGFTVNASLLFKEGTQYDKDAVVNIDVSVAEAEFQSLFGYLGQRELAAASDSIAFGAFDSFENGLFRMADPQLSFKLESGFGVPISIRLDQMRAVSSEGFVDLTGDYANTDVAIQVPANAGETATTDIVLNKETSNFADMIAALPEKLVYAFSGNMNPGGPGTLNFVLDTSKVDIVVDAVIPLYGSLTGLTQEIEMDFDGIDMTENVQSASIIMHTANTLPVDLKIQGYFKNEAGETLNTLFAEDDGQQLLKAPAIDADGNVDMSKPEENELIVTIDQDKLASVSDAKTLVLELTIATADEGTKDVRFTADQGVKVKVGMQAVLTQEINTSNE